MSLDAWVVARIGGFHLDAEVTVADGEVVALLGPNGAGKTTLLRALAGLQPLDGGHVTLAGTVVEDPTRRIRVPPEARGVGVVFQQQLLFPHLSSLENVAFGLRARGVPPASARVLASQWLTRMGLATHASAVPVQLSGGQAQRVALARALAADPALLLLDEPLAALDVETRRQVRRQLSEHLRAFTGPALLVSHDPVDALTLADRLVVLEAGRVTQKGLPADVAAHPRSPWIAELVGLNLLRGVASGTTVRLDDGTVLHTADRASGPVAVVVHPRAVALHRQPPGGSPRNVLAGEVGDLDVRGDHVRVALAGRVPLVAEVTPPAVAALDLAAGGTVYAVIKATELAVHLEPPEPGGLGGPPTG